MKHLITIVFLTTIFAARAQDQESGAFDRQKGVARIEQKRVCPGCAVKERHHVKTFVFDDAGYNIDQHDIHAGKKSGDTRYIWNRDGLITMIQSYQARGGTPSVVASASEKNKADKMMLWDSTAMTGEARYDYAGPRLNSITWTDGQQNAVAQTIHFYYDNDGKLARKEQIDQGTSGKVYGFDASNATIIDLPDGTSATNYTSQYQYVADSVYIAYSKNGVPTGTGKRRVNKSNKVIYEITFNTFGRVVYECRTRYNQSGQVIEKAILDSEIDGFGNSQTPSGADKITYRYDQRGRLAIIAKTKKNVEIVTDYFEYR